MAGRSPKFVRRVAGCFIGGPRSPTAPVNPADASLEEAIDSSVNPQRPDVRLHKLLSQDDEEKCKELLNSLEELEDPEKKRKLNEMNEEGLTLIHCVARCDGTHSSDKCTRLQCLERLIEIGADVETLDRSKATILHHAVQCGCLKTIKYILRHHKDLVNSKDHHGNTPLHYAVQCTKGMEKVSKKLIKHGADVNAKNEDDDTPLHIAAKLDKEELIDLLLDRKADIHAVDKRKHTPLLVAAAHGRKDAIACLAEHLDKDYLNQVDGDGKSALFLTVEAGHDIAVNKIMALARKQSSETDNLPCKASKTGDIPLHIAASRGNMNIVRKLLGKDCFSERQTKMKNKAGKTPLHVAAESGENEVVEMLVCQHPRIIQFCEQDETDTPLHLACANGHRDVVFFLLKEGAGLTAKNMHGETPFHLAASKGHKELVAELADLSDLCVQSKDNEGRTALRCACDERCIEVMSTLLKKGSDIRSEDNSGVTAIEAAIERGHEDVVEAIVESDDWVEALRHSHPDKDHARRSEKEYQAHTKGKHSDNRGEHEHGGEHECTLTPLRMMIQKMPAVAAKVLNRCTLRGLHPKYPNTVVFDYQFLEDFRNGKHKTTSQKISQDRQCRQREEEEGEHQVDTQSKEGSYKDEDGKYSKIKHLEAVEKRDMEKWQSTWGPDCFRKSNHPLMTMVDAGRLDLLEHPLVGSLLHYKWKTFGIWVYLTNMFTYLLFVISLTTFALSVMAPETEICKAVLNGTFCNTTGDLQCGDCGISSSQRHTIITFAILTILMTVVRFGLEILQMVHFKQRYLNDWTNSIELILFAFTIMFVFVFATPCLCPRNWQWQLGILAVFLAWIDLVLFVQKFPVIGIYIVMFLKICKTFLWTVSLSFLLIISFGLAFYMAFYEPQLELTGNSRDAFSTPARAIFMTMAMSTGELDFDTNFHLSRDGTDPELAFLPVTSIVWVIFVSVMPILFVNMLTGLAVDDVKEILKDAELSKLALQVELVLSVEERMPRWFQERIGWGTKKWRCAKIIRKASQWQKTLQVIWGGKLYNLRENIDAVLNPPVHTVEDQTVVLLSEMKRIKQAIADAALKQDEEEISKENLKDNEGKREDTLKEDVAVQFHLLKENIKEEVDKMKNQLLAEVEQKRTISQSLMQNYIQQSISPLSTQFDIQQTLFREQNQQIDHMQQTLIREQNRRIDHMQQTLIREQNQQIDHMQQTLIREQNRQIDHMQQTLIREQNQRIDRMQQTLILKQVEQRSQNERLASHNQMLEERMIRLERLVRAMAQHQGIQVQDPVI